MLPFGKIRRYELPELTFYVDLPICSSVIQRSLPLYDNLTFGGGYRHAKVQMGPAFKEAVGYLLQSVKIYAYTIENIVKQLHSRRPMPNYNRVWDTCKIIGNRVSWPNSRACQFSNRLLLP